MSIALSEHLPLLATAPGGVQKFRGLILELAVRGKLVPQDPNDEPASELLKRIEQERVRLEAAGICKKSKATPLDVDDAPPFKLPSGWVLSQLSDLTLVLNGRAYSKDELLSEGVPVLRVGNLFTSNHWYYSNLQLEDDKYCDQGDLLYSWSASFGPFIWQGPKVIYHYHIWKLRLFDESSLSKEFFYKFLLEKTAEIKAAGHGVSMIHMTKEKMEKILVPVPPLAEQHRIVAKVDELMALCDRLEAEQSDAAAAHDRLVATLLGTLTQSAGAAELAANWQRLAEHFDTLFTTEPSLDALKQTVLQLAVMGKLVPQDPTDKPASELLKRIATERARLEVEGSVKTSKMVPLLGKDNQPFDLPVGWTWASLSELLGVVTDGDHQPPPKADEGVPFLVIGNLNAGVINFSGCRFVPKRYFDELDWIKRPTVGDLLYSVTGSFGITIPVETNVPFCVQRHVAILKSVPSTPSPYLLRHLQSPISTEFAASAATGIAQKTVSLSSLRLMPIALPPLAEQHRIVAKVDELLALVDRLKADLAESRAQQERLATTLIESALKAA